MNELICFSNAMVLVGDELEIIRHCTVTVQAGRIIKIGEPASPNARSEDLAGRLLCPMMINAHTHVGDTGAKELGVGLPLAQVTDLPDGLKHVFLQSVKGTELHVAMMRHGLMEMLHNGIIASADFREQGLAGVRALRRAGEGLPIRVIALGRMSEGNDDDALESEARAILEEADGLGVRDVEVYPSALLRKLRAAYPGKILAAHSSEDYASEMRSRSQTGMGQAGRLLEWQPDFLVHLTYTPEEELRRLVEEGIGAVACPRSNGILGDGLPRLVDWVQNGLNFGLGTDNVMFNSPDMLREMDYASRLVRGMWQNAAVLEPRQFLMAATIHGAQLLHLDRDLGSLLPGKEASFIVFNLNTANLKYHQDVISAIVHRATPADIEKIYICGTEYCSGSRKIEIS